MGGTLSGAAFLRRCLGTGSEASACSKHTWYKPLPKSKTTVFRHDHAFQQQDLQSADLLAADLLIQKLLNQSTHLTSCDV